MTEKQYKMINTNLKDKDGVYYNIQRNDGFNVCQVFGKHTAREIVDELNVLHEENTRLKEIISANRTITIPYTITDEKLVKKLKEMFKGELE